MAQNCLHFRGRPHRAPRSHLGGVIPWQGGVEPVLFVTVDVGPKGRHQKGVRPDGVEFAGLDQRGESGPVFGTGIVAREVGVLTARGAVAGGPILAPQDMVDSSIDHLDEMLPPNGRLALARSQDG